MIRKISILTERWAILRLVCLLTGIFLLAACTSKGEHLAIIEETSYLDIDVVADSETPVSISFTPHVPAGYRSYVYLSSNKEDIDNLIQEIKGGNYYPIHGDYEQISPDIKMIGIEETHHNCCVYDLFENTKYYWAAIHVIIRNAELEKIILQPIKSFTTTYVKSPVDIGGSVLWDGYNYMDDKTVNDFIEAMNPPLFGKDNLPSIANSDYRYPTKDELEEICTLCELVYYDTDYNFVKVRSKSNGEVMYLPFTSWAPRNYDSFNSMTACFFPSKDGDFGLEYARIGNTGDRSFQVKDKSSFYTWQTVINGENVRTDENRGIRLVRNK